MLIRIWTVVYILMFSCSLFASPKVEKLEGDSIRYRVTVPEKIQSVLGPDLTKAYHEGLLISYQLYQELFSLTDKNRKKWSGPYDIFNSAYRSMLRASVDHPNLFSSSNIHFSELVSLSRELSGVYNLIREDLTNNFELNKAYLGACIGLHFYIEKNKIRFVGDAEKIEGLKKILAFNCGLVEPVVKEDKDFVLTSWLYVTSRQNGFPINRLDKIASNIGRLKNEHFGNVTHKRKSLSAAVAYMRAMSLKKPVFVQDDYPTFGKDSYTSIALNNGLNSAKGADLTPLLPYFYKRGEEISKRRGNYYQYKKYKELLYNHTIEFTKLTLFERAVIWYKKVELNGVRVLLSVIIFLYICRFIWLIKLTKFRDIKLFQTLAYEIFLPIRFYVTGNPNNLALSTRLLVFLIPLLVGALINSFGEASFILNR